MKTSKLIYIVVLYVTSAARIASAEITIRNLTVVFNTTVSGEYNDNLFLKNKEYSSVDSGFTLHVIPRLKALRSFNDHYLSFETTGEYMKGLTTDVSGWNVMLDGALNLKFSGGLNVKIKNTYDRVEEDWDLSNEIGINSRWANRISLEASYPFGNRLKADGGYEHGWEVYKEEITTSRLNSDAFWGKVIFPITWNTEGFGRYRFYRQYSDETDFWNSTEYLYEAGAEWKGPYRFSAEATAGYSFLEFDHPESLQYKDITYRLTLKSRLSEMMNAKAWAGINAYGKMEYGAELRHQSSDEATYTSVHVSRKTGRSYSSLSKDHMLETTKAVLQHDMRIFWNGRLQLQGGYMEQVSFTTSDYWFGSTKLNYPLKDWMDVGLYYNFRQRISDEDRYDYRNNRVGLNFMFIF